MHRIFEAADVAQIIDQKIAEAITGINHISAAEAAFATWGSGLAASSCYAQLPAAWIEDPLVFFIDPIDLTDVKAMTARLEQMVIATRDPDAIQCILNAAAFARPAFNVDRAGKQTPIRENRYRLIESLGELAAQLVTIGSVDPIFVNSLLGGFLRRAIEVALSNPELDEALALALVCQMTIVWGFHDSQMCASRMFNCVWVTDEEGNHKKASLTVSARRFEARLELKKTVLAYYAFQTASHFQQVKGQRVPTASYIEKRAAECGVLDIAHTLLNDIVRLKPAQPGTKIEREIDQSWSDLLHEHDRHFASTERALFPRQMDQTLTLSDRLRQQAGLPQVAKSRQGKGRSSKPTQKLFSRRRLDLAAIKYDASALEYMAVLLIDFVEMSDDVETLVGKIAAETAGRQITCTYAPGRYRAPPTQYVGHGPNSNTVTVTALLRVYRAVIIQDPNHFTIDYAERDTQRALDLSHSPAQRFAEGISKHYDRNSPATLAEKIPDFNPYEYFSSSLTRTATAPDQSRLGRPAIERAMTVRRWQIANPTSADPQMLTTVRQRLHMPPAAATEETTRARVGRRLCRLKLVNDRLRKCTPAA